MPDYGFAYCKDDEDDPWDIELYHPGDYENSFSFLRKETIDDKLCNVWFDKDEQRIIAQIVK